MTGLPEFKGRIRALQERLQQDSIDAALLTDASNIAYFTGYRPEHLFLSRTRLVGLIMGPECDPLVVVPASHAQDVQEETGISDIAVYDDLRHAPISQLAHLLKGLGARRVGMEFGMEQRVNMTVSDLDHLRQLLSAEIMDVTPCTWDLRLLKSPGELALIETACDIGERAFDACIANLRAGDSERDLADQLAAEVARRGGRAVFIIVTSGEGDAYRANGAPRDRRLRPTDVVFVDLGVRYRGYHADFNRVITVGEPQEEQVALQEKIRSVTEGAADLLCPGVVARDIYRTVLDRCLGAGLPVIPPGRVGHGLGLDVTEPPHISAVDETILQEGMVTTMEPAIERLDGLYCAECVYVVTARGGKLLNQGGSRLRRANGGPSG